MRIVFITTMTGASWGGSEELWSQSALRLAQAGHEVIASAEKSTPLPPKLAALLKAGVKLRLRDSNRGALAKAVMQRITGWRPKDPEKQWLLQQKPELVVISQGGIIDGITWTLFCKQMKLPYAAICHCNSESSWPPDDQSAQLADAYSGALQVYCVSQGNLRLLEQQLGAAMPNARVVWNPNNVATAGLVPWPKDDGIVRLACVGRLEPVVKGQDVLFKVLALPVWRTRPVELNLFGTGHFERSLRQMAANLKLANVHFRGHVNNIAEIWQDHHLLALASRWEGLPLTLVEAMSCGRPAVMTDVGGNAEMCLDGETGFIASAAAVGPMAEALERAWARRADWEKMGLAARRRIVELVPQDPIGDFCGLLTGLGERGLRSRF